MGGAPLTLAYCWAHSRRKLHDIYQKDASETAAEGLRRIVQIYKIEASVRERSHEEHLAVRQEYSASLVADFRLWLRRQRSRVSAKSRLDEKRGYMHRHWDGLQIFLTDGRIELDTNPVKNTIRPITLNRKNALFAGDDEGGRNWAWMALLIETCKLNTIDPDTYPHETLTAIANGHPAHRRPHASGLPKAVELKARRGTRTADPCNRDITHEHPIAKASAGPRDPPLKAKTAPPVGFWRR